MVGKNFSILNKPINNMKILNVKIRNRLVQSAEMEYMSTNNAVVWR